MRLSERITRLSESATLAVAQRARSLKEEGVDVINLAMGEPDFVTPTAIREAAKKALDDGYTGYAIPVSGVARARDAVREKFQRDNDLEFTSDQIIVTEGAKEALYLAFMVLLNDGDEVLIPTPYWVSYPEQVKLAGGKPVILHTDDRTGFRLTRELLESALTDRTRIVVLNSPSNPGGFVYTKAELQVIADVLSGRDIMVFADELYDRLTYDGEQHVSWATLNDHTRTHTMTFNAVSKTYAMTGWRLGYAAGPQEIIKAMSKLKGQITSGACHFGQYGLVEALTGDQACVSNMREAFDRRRKIMYDYLQAMPGATCVNPTGAMFCFPNLSGAFAQLGVAGSIECAHYLLDEAHIAVVPGAAFGCDQHVRMSYAIEENRVHEAMQRMTQCLQGACK